MACIVVLLAGSVALTGCQSKSHGAALTRGEAAAVSIQSAADTIQTANLQINRTLAALRNLTERPGDVPAQFVVVGREISALEQTASRIMVAADATRAKSDAYLADWGRQVATIGDAQLRGAAFDRRADTAARLQAIFLGYQTVKADYAPFQRSLADIQKALGADLSAKGLEAVRPFVAKATEQAVPLKASLVKLAGDFRAAGLELQPGVTE
jgi:hypothetical protein